VNIIQLLIILVLGIFLGLLIGNKDFRDKFFVGFRKFLGGINTGQRRSERGQAQKSPHPDEVRHRYIADHHLVKCPRCGGSGRVPKAMPKLLSKKLFGEQTEECPDCEGTGKIYD